MFYTDSSKNSLYHELEWIPPGSRWKAGVRQMISQSLPALPFRDDGFGVSYPRGRGGINCESVLEAKKRTGWLRAETGAVWADSWGWVYCFGSFLPLHEHLPHCLLAWQRRFAEIEVSLQGQDGEATRTHWHRVPPPVMKSDPEWLHLALKYANTTLQELSALQRSVSIGGFLQNRQVTQLPACLYFSSFSCQGVINSWKKEGMLKRDMCVTGYQNHEKGWKLMS